MSGHDELVAPLETLLRERVTPDAVRAIEAGADSAPLWALLADGGWLDLLASERRGGAGQSWSALGAVAERIGEHGSPMPWAATMAARAVLESCGLDVPDGPIAFASAVRRGDDAALVAVRVPWGSLARWVVADVDGDLVMLPADRATREPSGVHGSMSQTLRWRADAAVANAPRHGHDARLVAAAVHAATMAGAMRRCLALTVRHAGDRQQFGRPIAAFQAVQHQLAVMAEEVAAARMAAALAFDAAGDAPAVRAALPLPAVAAAKSRCSEAAGEVTAIAHAVHGAIGITQEHELQLGTRRLHEWRIDHGSESYWNLELGRALLAQERTAAEFVRFADGQAADGLAPLE